MSEQDEFDAPRPPRRSRAAIAARTGVALLSALVLVVTGYGWANYGDLRWALSTSTATEDAASDGATDILLVGLDSRTDAQGRLLPEDVLQRLRAGDEPAGLTDTLILVHVPESGTGATAVSLPRDTYTEIPGHGMHKINSAYGRGKSGAAAQQAGIADPAERERRAADAGRRLLTATVQRLTGVQVDHYAEVNLLGFAELTEAVGGVPVCLREAVHDPYSGASFPAGPQLISGTQALSFVRQRHGLPRGDLDRMVRQQAFLAGLARTALSQGLLTRPAKLAALLEQAKRSIVLDEDWDVLAFAQRMQGLVAGDVEFTTVPIVDAAYETPEDGQAVRVDPEQVRRAVQQAAHGRPAPRQLEPTGEAESPDETGGATSTADPTGSAEGPEQSGESGQDSGTTGSGTTGSGTTGSGTTGESGSGESGTTAGTATPQTAETGQTASEETYEQATTAQQPTTTRYQTGEETYQAPSTERQTEQQQTEAPAAEESAPTGEPIAPDPFTADGLHCVN